MNITNIKEQIITWTRDYFEQNGKDCKAIVGISGGKDSSITSALCVQALGSDRVYGVLMPYGEQYDINVSKELITYLGIQHCEINIKDTVDTLWAGINHTSLEVNRQAFINILPRVRMTTLYAISAILNGRVANNCNLSETYVGYSTKYGDSAGDFSLLSKLTVTEVKQIGMELGLPSKFIDKVPEDGLSGLSDEENIGVSYTILDKYIREGICEDAAIKEKIDKLHCSASHKVSQMPCFDIII
jgi:NAD+ synthase